MGSFNDLVSDLEDNINLPQSEAEKDLQRTAEWFEQRKGRFTGSEIHKLMSCTRATSKMEWGRVEKLVDFSETAKKYVFSKFKERQRNKIIRTHSTYTMRYGADAEVVIKELLKEKYIIYNIEEVGFKEIKGLEGIAGASPDGLIISSENLNLEIKASTTWDAYYNRIYNPFDENHQDFWQVQTEMMAQKISKTLYVVSEPPENILDPEITDIRELDVMESITHQNAIFERCKIGDKAIQLMLAGKDIHTAIQIACTQGEVDSKVIYDFDYPF